MKIEVNINKKFALMILGAFLIMAGTIYANAYGGSSPVVMGHSGGEIDVDDDFCMRVTGQSCGYDEASGTYTDINTNAETICEDNKYLKGNGVCKTADEIVSAATTPGPNIDLLTSTVWTSGYGDDVSYGSFPSGKRCVDKNAVLAPYASCTSGYSAYHAGLCRKAAGSNKHGTRYNVYANCFKITN